MVDGLVKEAEEEAARKRLSRVGRRRVVRLAQSVVAVREVVSRLEAGILAELVRHDEVAVEHDGYPSRSGGGGGGAPAVTVPDEHGDPDSVTVTFTEAAVFARGDDHRRDPIGDAVRYIEAALPAVAEGLRRIDRARASVVHAADDKRGRISSLQGTCSACQRDVTGVGVDRLRRGWCTACYTAFLRWRNTRPTSQDPGGENSRFEAFRRQQLADRLSEDAGPDLEWRVLAIDGLRAGGSLPTQRPAS